MKTRCTHATDEELLDRLRYDGDRKAFEALYERYASPIFDYIYARVHDRYTAQEIVQELFVSLWQKHRELAVRTCQTYLFGVAKNLIISQYRKEMAREARQRTWEMGRLHQEENADQETLVQDLRIRYQEALSLLPEKCQRVFTLSRDGLTNREVAEQLNISEKTVEQHITKALRFLKVYLREYRAYLVVLTSFL